LRFAIKERLQDPLLWIAATDKLHPCPKTRKRREEEFDRRRFYVAKEKNEGAEDRCAMLLVFTFGVTLGLGRSHRVSALSNSTYEELKLFTDISASFRRTMWRRENQRISFMERSRDVGNVGPSLSFHASRDLQEMQAERKVGLRD